ncbi:MAG: DNA topoisomerase I [Bacteroidetes bacterium CG23_combo_of_CG06-09_8_20_14_all_32_9]|nr:MAG: DNA topoisomerase I [Bacteroidetes bacterium CG23_combo_of_CG06-09_8_20_14_all_32_9]
MEENLVIVESPAKAKTISKFIGKEYLVKSSFGHIRDLSKKKLGVDIENNFKPNYEVPEDKVKIVSGLKKLAKSAKIVWLASDEDREGEAISWHLFEVLKLKESATRRIVFHEITKEAIQNAIKNPRGIDYNLVYAQQARRILDRLVGFELSPLLWKKIRPSLSAGRVQSVAVRLIVEREREIFVFKAVSQFKVSGIFIITDKDGKNYELKADIQKGFQTKNEAQAFLEKCKNSIFTISDIQTKPLTKSPAPPFTTSTLQQEASRKLSFSVAQTMILAQKLYEAGHITYMRTDSVHLSDLAIFSSKKEVEKKYGKEYSKTRQFQTKTKGAQEAHEAIRPTYFNKNTVSATGNEKRLYQLIWKRAIASQMSEAKLEKTTVTINMSNASETFLATGEVIKFDGFLKVYMESTDDENEEQGVSLLPPMQKKQKIAMKSISADEKFNHHPARYTEASLVRKLEELGIGRPSTYAPTISTIQNRGYIIKEDRQGSERKVVAITLINKTINEQLKTENFGYEKAKLFPTDIGIIVNDFLVENFSDILDFNFTASVELEFDQIAEGKKEWSKMIKGFYKNFHLKVDESTKKIQKKVGERLLGTDHATGKPVYVKFGKYGPFVQLGDKSEEQKPHYAGLQQGQHIETITLYEALQLFTLPRKLGLYNEKDVVANTGRFGPYVLYDKKFCPLKKGIDNPYNITLERAIEVIIAKQSQVATNTLRKFPEDTDLHILKGKYSAYIRYKNQNFRLPTKSDWNTLTYNDFMDIIKQGSQKKEKINVKNESAI